LRLLPGSSITGNVSMNSNSTLDLSGTGSASFNVSGIGTQYTGFNTFTKSGSSTWTLTGSGNQAWTISAGTLVGDTTSIQGSITNNATLTFNQTFNGTTVPRLAGPVASPSRAAEPSRSAGPIPIAVGRRSTPGRLR
jgi:hypothetical protein